MIIYKSDLALVGFCSRGTRAFFLSQNWDWQDFLKHGRDAEDFIKTQNAMAIQLVEAAKKVRNLE